MKSKIFTKIIASAMSVMMIFSMSGVSVKAAQLQENNELKTVMVDMKDVATGDAIVYRVDIMVVKCKPDMISVMTHMKGFLPGYHMDKSNWITILLDGTVQEAKILDFLDMSYDLTDGRIEESIE